MLHQFRSMVEWIDVTGSGTIKRTINANFVIVVTNGSVAKCRISK